VSKKEEFNPSSRFKKKEEENKKKIENKIYKSAIEMAKDQDDLLAELFKDIAEKMKKCGKRKV